MSTTVLQDLVRQHTSVSKLTATLKKKLGCAIDTTIVKSLHAFINALGMYRTGQMADALGTLFSFFSVEKVAKPRGKAVIVTLTCFRPYVSLTDTFPSIKMALDVYGKRSTFGDEGISAGQVTRRLKKEREGQDHFPTGIGQGFYVKFCLA